MKKLHVILPTKDFMNDKVYSDLLADYEAKEGAIDNVIAHKCANVKDQMILEILFKTK